jgi:hypothetical protein
VEAASPPGERKEIEGLRSSDPLNLAKDLEFFNGLGTPDVLPQDDSAG